jgi:hypothetical protein
MVLPTQGYDMATQQPILQAIFPDLPRETPVLDEEGDFMPLWSLGFASLFQALQNNYKSEGIMIPKLTSAQATTIANLYTKYFTPVPIPLPVGVRDISGQMIYNTTIAAPQIFIINFDGSTPPNVTAARWWTFTIT